MGVVFRIMRLAVALVSMAAGSFAVLAAMVAMNTKAPPPKSKGPKAAAQFSMETKKPPPKKERPKPQRKTKPLRQSQTAPAPRLSSALSGFSFGLPQFSQASLAANSDTLVGATRSAEEMVMTEEAVDNPPQPAMRTQPKYPPRARAKGVTGMVVLSILVGPTGDVLRIKVLEATPAGVFEEAAQEAVRTWRFQPGTYKGTPVKVWARQVIRFELG